MSTIDHLKKSAKRWLKLLRAGDAAARQRLVRAYPDAPEIPVLRDVQHALARERGYASWIELSTALPPAAVSTTASLPQHDAVARALQIAYAADDEEAIARVREFYEAPLSHADVRAIVWQRIRRVREQQGAAAAFTLEEARDMVARDRGYGGWSALSAALQSVSPIPPAPAFAVRREELAASPIRVMSSRDWDALIGEMREHRVTQFDGNGILTDAVLARIAAIDTITSLTLGGSRLLTDAGVMAIAGMPQLEHLNIGEYPGGVLTDRALDVLQHLPNLRRFGMSWQLGITDAGTSSLRHCPALESVDLLGSHSGDLTVAALQHHQHLRKFVTGRHVTDDGVATLARFRTLAELSLDGPFSNAGLSALAGARLEKLSFFWHAVNITSSGLAILQHLPQLSSLALDGTLCDDIAFTFAGRMPMLRDLQAQGAIASDEGYVALSQSRTLESIWGRDMTGLGDQGFAALASVPTIRALSVNCANVSTDRLSLLREMPSLRKLTSIGIRDEGFTHVGACDQLEDLSCMYCRDTTDVAMAHIAGLPRLRQIYAGATQVTDAGLASIARIDSLEGVELCETLRVTDAGVQALARLPRLKKVSISGIPGVSALAVAAFAPSVRVEHHP